MRGSFLNNDYSYIVIDWGGDYVSYVSVSCLVKVA